MMYGNVGTDCSWCVFLLIWSDLLRWRLLLQIENQQIGKWIQLKMKEHESVVLDGFCPINFLYIQIQEAKLWMWA